MDHPFPLPLLKWTLTILTLSKHTGSSPLTGDLFIYVSSIYYSMNTQSLPNYDFGSPEELLSSNITLEDLLPLYESGHITGTQYQKYSSVLDPHYEW